VPAALLCLIALAFVACGGERSFDAEEFVGELNDHGAGLTLEGSLPNEQAGVEVYSVAIAANPGEGEDDHSGEGGHSGGSLVVADDGDGAIAEHERCEGAVSFICFRAANAVLIVEDGSRPQDIERVGAAIRALESD